MIWFLLACAAGFVLLARAADEMVVGAARLATAFRVSPVVVGAVVVGFGTSAPEMLVSALAAAQGSIDIAVGNVLGSNVANLTLVLGVAAAINVISLQSSTLRREAPLAVGGAILFALFVQGGLNRVEGAVLLVALAGSLWLIMRAARSQGDSALAADVEELVDGTVIRTRTELWRTAIGLVGTLVGAQLLVEGATGFAGEAGLAEGFVGVSLVALGTSLPELVTAVAAARRREDDLVVGNLLGSNLFNSLAVGGIAALAGPGPLDDPDLAGWASLIMVAVALGTWALMRRGEQVVRIEGFALVGIYVIAVPLLAL